MSSLYYPYRAVGYVCDSNPFSINRLGEEIFVSVSIGKCFQVYRLNKLIACLVSKNAPGFISSIQTCGHETYAAVGNAIVVFDRANVVRQYTSHTRRIRRLLNIGKILISYDEVNEIKIHDTKARTLIGEISMLSVGNDQADTANTSTSTGSNGDNAGFITTMMHPATYVNKIVIGFSSGRIELWNFNRKKLIYTYKSNIVHLEQQRRQDQVEDEENENASFKDNLFRYGNTTTDKASGRAGGARGDYYHVLCVEQSPACDVVALGYGGGQILLLQLKLDQVLFAFTQQGGAAVTSLSFRSDAGAQKCPFLASSSSEGRIHIWNLGVGDSARLIKKNYGDDKTSNINNDDDDDDDDNDHTQERAALDMRNRLERKVQSTIEDAHRGGAVSRVCFVPGEPLMISAGAEDNSLKVWIFDTPDGNPRLLRSREGHQGAPTRIRYYGGTTHVSMRDNADGMSCELVSAGSDGTLRLFNTAIEAQNRELSQKPILKKLGLLRRGERLPECIGFDFSETRQRDWGNLVSIHQNCAAAYVWKYRHRVVTEMILSPAGVSDNVMRQYSDRSTHASAVALSACGNFCVVGTRGGLIYKYNIQSGLRRGTFPADVEAYNQHQQRPHLTIAQSDAAKARLKRETTPGNIYHDTRVIQKQQVLRRSDGSIIENQNNQSAVDDGVVHEGKDDWRSQIIGHIQEVSGIFVDILGTTMVSVGYDGRICFWDFNTQKLLHCLDIGTPLVLLEGFRDAGFVAVASQDHLLRVFDVSTFKLSRRFSNGHTREITDMGFTPDGRRLLSAALDSTLRVWDLPTGRCLNWLLFDAPILSMTISLSGEYLCVAQAEKEGIYVYIDKSLYETVHFWREPVEPTPIADSQIRADLAPTASEQDTTLTEDDDDKDGGGKEEQDDQEPDSGGEDDADTPVGPRVVTPSQAQIISNSDKSVVNTATAGSAGKVQQQRKGPVGTITLSDIPRAYWTSLFQLEAIKQRNQPIAPPTPAPQAPFFLPSVVRAGGSAPSFPTPAEYEKLTRDLNAPTTTTTTTTTSGSSSSPFPADSISGSDGKKGAIKRSGGVGTEASSSKSKKSRKDNDEEEGKEEEESVLLAEKSEEQILQELAGMGSAWSDDDDDDDDDDGDDNEGAEKQGDVSWSLDARKSTPTERLAGSEDSIAKNNNNTQRRTQGQSRILSKQTKLPRCKLVAYLEKEALASGVDYFQQGIGSSQANGTHDNTDHESLVMAYLKQLPPPAVDLELRALCTHESEDTEGVQLLRYLLHWLTRQVATGRDFEVLQAYLHRTLVIYLPLVVKMDADSAERALLIQDLSLLQQAHTRASERFRHLVQKNLCLLKLMGNLPIT